MSARGLRPLLLLLRTGLPRIEVGAAKRAAPGTLRTLSDLAASSRTISNSWRYVVGVVSGVGLAAFIYQWRAAKASLVPELNAGGSETPKVSHRELRYKEFASLVYKGEPYMSARDFLESVSQDESRGESQVVLELDPRKIGKEGLVNRARWKCKLWNVRNFINC